MIGGGDWAENRIVPDCVRAWSKNEVVHIRSPHSTRPWQHVLEPLSGYLTLAHQLSICPSLNGSSFNFGPDANNNFSVIELISSLSRLWESSSYFIDENPNSTSEAGLLKLCCDKAQYLLDWKPTLSFDQTVSFTSSWYKSYYASENIQEVTLRQINQYSNLYMENLCNVL